MSQVGWTDPAHHAVGLEHAKALRAALGPLSTPDSGYINLVDIGEGGSGGVHAWFGISGARVLQQCWASVRVGAAGFRVWG